MLHKGFKDVDAAEAELKLVLKACEYITASTAGACYCSGMQDESLVRIDESVSPLTSEISCLGGLQAEK